MPPSKLIIAVVVVVVVCAAIAAFVVLRKHGGGALACGTLLPNAEGYPVANNAGFCYQSNVVHGAGAFGVGHMVASTPNAGACAVACANDPQCTVANWNNGNNNCWGYNMTRATIEQYQPTPNTGFATVVDSHVV
jgi:hypothetical protein